MSSRTAIIIGAGPAGLTAAYELLDSTDIHPIVLEMTGAIGGISQTVEYHGNRMDIGGHRFFSKSDRVMEWWRNILPLQGAPARDDRALGREVPLSGGGMQRPLRAVKAHEVDAPDPETDDLVMLMRNRLSRIIYLSKFFDYPVSLSKQTLLNLGFARVMKIGMGIMRSSLFKIKPERSLEDFFINRFGRELYRTFFKDYTEKVWGVPCRDIPAEWGAQRIKGLSVGKALAHAFSQLKPKKRDIAQKEVETSLIEQFCYPKFGPGQLWETVADQIKEAGGEIRMNTRVIGLHVEGNRVAAVEVEDVASGVIEVLRADFVLSSMPVRELINNISPAPPAEVVEVADGLGYRDFMTVGLLLKRLRLRNTTNIPTLNELIPDNWIYVQEPHVRLGRIQIFNNWSPYLVADPSNVWIGLEYFCNAGDELWKKVDDEFSRYACDELATLGIIERQDILDHVVIRMPKAYPAYFGRYAEFPRIREYVDKLSNLYLIGRNGMHRYNNMDHSMLTAMLAVEQIAAGKTDREALWSINAESEYHESKS